VAINTGDKALLQIERILAAFGPGDAALLSRMVLVAQGGSVAYRFVPHLRTAEGARLEQHVRVELVQEWNGWNITLQHDLATAELAQAPVHVDDKLGGHGSWQMNCASRTNR
jgi:hypothetical protein